MPPPSRSQQHRRARPLETSNNTGIIVLIPPIKTNGGARATPRRRRRRSSGDGADAAGNESEAGGRDPGDRSILSAFLRSRIVWGKKQLLYVATRCCEVDPFACFSFLFLPSVFVEMKLPSMFHL